MFLLLSILNTFYENSGSIIANDLPKWLPEQCDVIAIMLFTLQTSNVERVEGRDRVLDSYIGWWGLESYVGWKYE